MRRYPDAAPLGAAVLAAVAATLAAGCSSSDPESSNDSSGDTPEPAATTVEAARPGVGVSPGGITTRVDVPSAATESQYGQACLAAKRWMDIRGGDPKAHVEPYLEVLQEPGLRDPGNFNTPWTDLTPAQHAGVIMAVNAAADGQCG